MTGKQRVASLHGPYEKLPHGDRGPYSSIKLDVMQVVDPTTSF